MSESSNTSPFQPLGTHLRYLREQSNQSLAEVSGAVEIDETALERIEAGLERPAEDVLLLLISYFGMKDQEAIQLWELAGYSGDVPEQLRPSDDISGNGKNVVMLLAMDMRTVYTDGLDVATNRAGVTLTFTQLTGQNKVSPVARLGMSYQQAEQVIRTLHQSLLKAKYLNGPLQLPPFGLDGSSGSTAKHDDTNTSAN
jgi:transcriptional regulator with XRE-family HTH domain